MSDDWEALADRIVAARLRDDTLAELIWTTSRADESTISATGANIVTDAILRSDWLAQHDARIRAEALREAADGLHEWMGEPSGPFSAAWLRDRADRIERETVTHSDATAGDDGYTRSPAQEGR